MMVRLRHRDDRHPLVDADLRERMRVGVGKQVVIDPFTKRSRPVNPLDCPEWLALAEWQRLRVVYPADQLPLFPASLRRFAHRIQEMGPTRELERGYTAPNYTDEEMHFFVALVFLSGTLGEIKSRFMALSRRLEGGVIKKASDAYNAVHRNQ